MRTAGSDVLFTNGSGPGTESWTTGRKRCIDRVLDSLLRDEVHNGFVLTHQKKDSICQDIKLPCLMLGLPWDGST